MALMLAKEQSKAKSEGPAGWEAPGTRGPALPSPACLQNGTNPGRPIRGRASVPELQRGSRMCTVNRSIALADDSVPDRDRVLASLVNAPVTDEVTPGLSVVFLVVAFALNFSGTKTLARVARIGLAAELVSVVGLGLYLLIFQRKQEFSVFFNTMGVQGNGSYVQAFLGAALAGLFLFYGFEACGDVAEEVKDPARRIPWP
jgi:Amino acid permease